MNGAGQKTAHLDDKKRELIPIAAAITHRCDGCITVHTAAARKFGGSMAEIAEATGVAISVNACAAIIYATRALDAFAAAEEVYAQSEARP